MIEIPAAEKSRWRKESNSQLSTLKFEDPIYPHFYVVNLNVLDHQAVTAGMESL